MKTSLNKPCIGCIARSLYTFTASLLQPSSNRTSWFIRHYGSKSSSSKRWLQRQHRDEASREATLRGLKSRAAWKLIEINKKYEIIKPGMTVVDLGYAPGSWSQVAVHHASPGGRVLGVDIIPVAPPKGASSIQGNFLQPSVQRLVRRFLSSPDRGRPGVSHGPQLGRVGDDNILGSNNKKKAIAQEEDVLLDQPGYIDQERHETEDTPLIDEADNINGNGVRSDERNTADVVLSDMCEPWPLTGLWKTHIKNPYDYFSNRLMNTSGIPKKDHIDSMNLCNAALKFCVDVLKTNGSFVCKFYQGGEDKDLEKRLKQVFNNVNRVKPDSSRDESREAYFVALRKKPNIDKSIIDAINSLV